MKTAVIGGGVLGLTLAYRLASTGHSVDLLEAEPALGGLAAAHDYGPFTWDRFYHCILPQDTSLLALLADLGLERDLRWARTGTGYYARGRMYDMNGNADFLRFPLLTLTDKARLAAAVIYATRFANPNDLYRVSAEQWLMKICGRHAYTVFWQPLLKAKFGPFHDQVAAVFIYATLVRLFGARSKAAGAESLGYVSGGYRRILERFADKVRAAGGTIRTGTPVTAIIETPAPAGGGPGARVEWRGGAGSYDQVFFTAPTRLARKVTAAPFLPHVASVERDHPTSSHYLGVACLVLALEQPLTPYYVLNIGEPSIELTGLIEMTNLVDRMSETEGLSLLYLPRYMDSESKEFEGSDAALRDAMFERGLKRLFPSFDPARARYAGVHRARYVQPLPLVRDGGGPEGDPTPALARPFQVLNTAMLRIATLNNNEVVALVDRFMTKNRAALVPTPGPSRG
ncbi:MAG TPA: FAD-dependent oxidoreductase [Candidatus Polarisedimenticolia bacterium]|jgi:protoporphyrinogen oxidase|nr:FAD-dependent oxidoreductase [Candidatus Polarisedimenticolia bacterium]